MQSKYKLIARWQLDKTLSNYATAKKVTPPAKGWIHVIREALGMSGKQLAQRLNVSQSRIPKLEQAEVVGGVSLRTMRQIAAAMDCDFVYAIVPRASLEGIVREQAHKVAKVHAARVQDMSAEDQRATLDAVVNELALEMPRELWG